MMLLVGHKELFAKFEGKPPASRESIDRCQAGLGIPLPADYVQFLLKMDGGEGFIGEHFVMLWSVERFVEMNTGTYFAEAAPGLVVFGSDGGGEAFGFDARSTPPPIVMIPYSGMEWDVAIMLAPDFNSFLQHLYQADDLFVLGSKKHD
jgi:SMI1 / KNR4 family (SUKH-1)